MTNDYRSRLLALADRLGIVFHGDDLDKLSATDIEAIICAFDPAGHAIVAGEGDDQEEGTLDHFADGMAVIRWHQGTVTPCPVDDLRPL